MKVSVFMIPWIVLKRSSPRGEMAEIKLMLKRLPVLRITGVFPMGAQVVPLW